MDTPDIRTVAAFRREGWTKNGLRAAVEDGTLDRVRRGSYAPASERSLLEDHLLRTAAAWGVRSPDHVVSHTSAAVLHGLPVRNAALAEVHLTRWSSCHGNLKAGVRLHRAKVPDGQVVVLHGIRVTCLERTIADLARWEPFEWGVAATDAALRAEAHPQLMVELADQGNRKRNNGRFRQVLAFADARAESTAESMSRVSIARAGLPTPELQFEVHLPERGGWVATSDFGWPEQRIVGEMDGKTKYTADPRRGRTAADVIMDEKQRDALIVECDYTPTHWGWQTACDHRALGRHLRAVFATRGFRL